MNTMIPAAMPARHASVMNKPTAQEGRLCRVYPHMKPARNACNIVFHMYIQMMKSNVHDRDGCARMPVRGGSGIEVAGRGTAGFSSKRAISSGVNGGGDSSV